MRHSNRRVYAYVVLIDHPEYPQSVVFWSNDPKCTDQMRERMNSAIDTLDYYLEKGIKPSEEALRPIRVRTAWAQQTLDYGFGMLWEIDGREWI